LQQQQDEIADLNATGDKRQQPQIADPKKEIVTGHIDFLQVRNGAIHILDYKPDARTNKPIRPRWPTGASSFQFVLILQDALWLLLLVIVSLAVFLPLDPPLFCKIVILMRVVLFPDPGRLGRRFVRVLPGMDHFRRRTAWRDKEIDYKVE
jgi:hypothetical protein